MGSHDILRASMIAQEIGFERERQIMIRHHREMAKQQGSGQISDPTWFEGMKATARFLADAARAGRPPSWSALAADLGYADQSHLARDFRATVGLTPSDYAASVVPLHPEGGDPPRRDGA